jgi:hypothetical protein
MAVLPAGWLKENEDGDFPGTIERNGGIFDALGRVSR